MVKLLQRGSALQGYADAKTLADRAQGKSISYDERISLLKKAGRSFRKVAKREDDLQGKANGYVQSAFTYFGGWHFTEGKRSLRKAIRSYEKLVKKANEEKEQGKAIAYQKVVANLSANKTILTRWNISTFRSGAINRLTLIDPNGEPWPLYVKV